MTTKQKRTRDDNLLSKRHFSRIVKRPYWKSKRLFPIWALTFMLRGQTRVPLGSASMMVQSSHECDGRHREAIELSCVSAQQQPKTGEISYASIRMSHAFERNPHAGARGRILDPRDPGDHGIKRGHRPNGDWCRGALGLDQARVKACENNWELGVIPELPRFEVAYEGMDSIEYEMSNALKDVIAEHMGRPRRFIDAMPECDLVMLGKAHWPDLWTAPGVAGNTSSFFVIDHKFTTQLERSKRVIEDFSGMLGEDVWNPAHDLAKYRFANPARRCAEAAGFDLDEAFALLRNTEAGEESVEAVEDQILGLRLTVRGALGSVSPLFSDDDVDYAITSPDAEMVSAVGNPVEILGEAVAVEWAREYLAKQQPHLLPCVTDADLASAMQKPAAPLYASKLCKTQVLRRDLRTAPADAFSFSSVALERDRVSANLWPAQFDPRGQSGSGGKKRRNKKKDWHRHATSKSVPVGN